LRKLEQPTRRRAAEQARKLGILPSGQTPT
jgi:hypothetical protein